MRLAQCDRCGTVVSGWTTVEATRRIDDVNVSTFADLVRADLCDSCTVLLRKFLKEGP